MSYASCCDDGSLICSALCLQVLGITIEDMNILGRDIDMREEVCPHKRVVTLGVLLVETDILVHIERYDILKRHLTCFV